LPCPGDGRISKFDLLRTERLLEPLGQIRWGSAEIHDDLSFARVVEQASWITADAIDMSATRQSKEDYVSACGNLLQVVRRFHTLLTQTLQRSRPLIVRNDRMATLDREIAAHGLAHDADSDKTDYHMGKA